MDCQWRVMLDAASLAHLPQQGCSHVRNLLLAVAVITAALEPRSTEAQITTALNERAGLFSCTCGNGRAVPPVTSPAVALGWQQLDSINARLSAIDRRMQACLSNPPKAGSYQETQCRLSQSEKSSIQAQYQSVLSQARVGEAMARAQCAAACAAAPAPTTAKPPATGLSPSSSTSRSTVGSVPTGNDWSLGNTISGRRPITGLSPTQQRWEDEKQKTIKDFKPLGPKPLATPKAAVAKPPVDTPSTPPATGFKPLTPRAPEVPKDVVPPVLADSVGDLDLQKLLADDLLNPGSAEIAVARAGTARKMAWHISAALPAANVRELTAALRSGEVLPNLDMNSALASARRKAMAALDRAAALFPPDPKKDLRPFFRNNRLFETSIVPALKVLEGGGQ